MTKFKLLNAKRIKTGTSQIVSFEIPRIYEAEYRELVRKSPDRLNLELSTPKKLRSTGAYSQNHHFNAHLMQICEDSGNDFADVKLFVKRKAFKRGLPFATKKNGDILYSLIDMEPLPISETQMTTEQCGWCIEECHELAADLGIRLIEE